MGYFEDSHFMAPHLQSVVPVRDGSVLRMVRENDGLDVAMEIGLSGQFFPMCLNNFKTLSLIRIISLCLVVFGLKGAILVSICSV